MPFGHCLSFTVVLHRLAWSIREERAQNEPKSSFTWRLWVKTSARQKAEICLLCLLGCRGSVCVVGTKYEDLLLLYLLETEGYWYNLIELTPYRPWAAETAGFLLKLQQFWVFFIWHFSSHNLSVFCVCVVFITLKWVALRWKTRRFSNGLFESRCGGNCSLGHRQSNLIIYKHIVPEFCLSDISICLFEYE